MDIADNVFSLAPTAPEPLTVEELDTAMKQLFALVGEISPADAMPPTTDALFRRHAFCGGKSGMDEVERLMRQEMRRTNVSEGLVEKFKMTRYRNWASDMATAIKKDSARRQKIAKDNAKRTGAGRADMAAHEFGGEEGSITVDALSNNAMLKARARLIKDHGRRVWLDTFRGKVMSDWGGEEDVAVIKPFAIEDDWMRNVWFHLVRNEELWKLGKDGAYEAIQKVAYEDKRNAPRDWLRGLVWDGTPRLETWVARVYHTPQDAYHAAIGRCWFVGMAARANEPGCKMDYCPVLYGPEGTRKSTSVEVIGGEWTGTINVSADKQDFFSIIRGKLVGEVAELESLMNRHTTSERMKTVITTRVDEWRMPYAHLPIAVPRTCVLVGTTNNIAWHKDSTGGRRFWPIHVARVADTEWLIENREQLFAEAQARYAAGESWHDVPEPLQKAAIQRHYAEADPWIGIIDGWLRRPDADLYTGLVGTQAFDGTGILTDEEFECWGNVITTSRVGVQALGMPKDKLTRSLADRIADIMRELGWHWAQPKLKSGGRPRVWVKSSVEPQLFDKTQ